MNCGKPPNRITCLTTALTVAMTLSYGGAHAAMAAKKRRLKLPPVVVQAVRAQSVSWQRCLVRMGTFMASRHTQLTAGIDGHIRRLSFHQGAFVSKGSPLMVLSHEELDAAMNEQRATLKLNTLQYKRMKKLLAQRLVSQASFDEAKARFQAARAKLQNLQAKMDKKIIKAPFSGVLGLKRVSVGDYVMPTTPLGSLQTLHPLWIDFSLPQRWLSKVKKGLTVSLLVDDEAHRRPLVARVIALDPQISAQSRQIDLRAQLPNPDFRLKPGGSARVRLCFGPTLAYVALPETAVIESLEGPMVYRLSGTTATKQTVQVVERRQGRLILSRGVKAGDRIVSEGQLKLYEGAQVVVAGASKNKK